MTIMNERLFSFGVSFALPKNSPYTAKYDPGMSPRALYYLQLAQIQYQDPAAEGVRADRSLDLGGAGQGGQAGSEEERHSGGGASLRL